VSILQGRGARLSFLGGRKKELTNGDHAHAEPDTASDRSKSIDKERNNNRRSMIRNGTTEGLNLQLVNTENSEWLTDSGDQRSADARTTGSDRELDEKSLGSNGVGAARLGSVRKRLSMLKLGRKTSRERGVMKSVDEE
jgi:hypothetical protein